MNPLPHLLLPQAVLGRRFPSHALSAIEEAIEKSEALHSGEIRIAIEVALDVRTLLRCSSARERALEVFAELRVWGTAARNGVLVYVLLAERDVEIVADQGFEGRVTQAEWEGVCTLMEKQFRERAWRNGVLHGIDAITRLLVREFPLEDGRSANEQEDRPAVL